MRSHHGCARCKRRRQKCDENKPSCFRCVEAQVVCEYLVKLKWDGRVPRQNDASKRKRRRTDNETSNMDAAQSHTPQIASPQSQLSPLPASGILSGPSHIRELSILTSWIPAEKLLWDHFVTTASMVASHSQLREQICHEILPIAIQIPSLMYGTLALSALHRLTLLNTVPETFTPEATISNLMSKSLKHLREELKTHSPQSRHLLLHTIRTLCVCEIYSGKADSAWRIHVDGARAILSSMRYDVGPSESDGERWLTSRWYSSMEALIALTDRGAVDGCEQHDEVLSTDNALMSSQNHFLDIYTGYSSDLNAVFQDIGVLARRRQGLVTSSDLRVSVDLQIQSDRLEGILQEMIRRDREEGLKIPPGVLLPKAQLKQFNACNIAYQHSALLHIYRRLQHKRRDSEEVQASVQKILDTVTDILPMEALSPWALLTTPIFTAG